MLARVIKMEQIEISKEIENNPYSRILSWAEQRLYLMGAKIFTYASLQPISLIMPKIMLSGNLIRPNIHLLVLSPSSSGKTTASKMFEQITYNPIPFESITSARFEEVCYNKDNISLINGDISRIFKDPILIKTMEGVLGEETRISRLTMRKTREFEVNAIFLGFGLPNALSKYIGQGLLQRLVPHPLFHQKDEQMEIGRWFTENLNLKTKETIRTEEIKSYYQKLWNIQHNKDRDFEKIGGWVLEDTFKWTIFKRWESLKDELRIPDEIYIIRELQSAYKYLYASSMLNIFNRKIEENKLVPNREDLDLAIQLFVNELRMKMKIWDLDKMLNQVRDVNSLYNRIINDDNIPNLTKRIAKALVNGREQ